MKKTAHSNKIGITVPRSSLSKINTESKLGVKPGNVCSSQVKIKDGVKFSKNVQFVRNTSMPIKKSNSSVSFTPCLQTDSLINKDELSSNVSENISVNSNIKLNVPELCSSLRFANKLLEHAVHESKSAAQLSNFVDACSSNNFAKSKVLRKVNIPFEEQIYRDLIDLKVTDSDLFPDHERRFRTKQIVRNKDKEPELSEFYQPSFNQEFVIKSDKIKVDLEKVIHYNGFSISDRIKRWESL